MVPFLLLDTCILKRLIATNEFSQHLTQIKFIIDNKHIILLAPDVLITEWQKHREEEKRRLDAELRSEKMDAKLRVLFKDASAEFRQEKIDEAYELLLTQLDTVDDLLHNKSIRIATTPELLMLVHEQRTAGKMPFGKKNKDNTNDALLIFSALDYLTRTNKNEFYFISDNHTEFAAGSPGSYFLHPHIAEKFSTIFTHYFTKIEDGYTAFDSLNIPRYKKKYSGNSNRIKNIITVDRTKPILHQMHEYLERRFVDLSFIPKKLFTEHYPFIKSDTFLYAHRPNALITDNQEVFDLLTKVKIVEDNVSCDDPDIVKTDEDKEKVKGIFRILFNNNIAKVAFKEKEPEALVYTTKPVTCNCAMCQYKRMDWHDIIVGRKFPERSEQDFSTEGRLLAAYGHYKVGHYVEAARQLQQLYTEKENEKSILLYIIGFNLKHLAPILHSHYWKDSEVAKLAEQLFEFDLDKLFKECSTPENFEILQWLHRKTFISEALSVMYVKVDEITDHFYRQNSGYNENTHELTEQYNSIDFFLSRNGITYDYFSKFQDLTDLQTQGLLASYGCSPLMGGRLSHLTDYWLTKLLLSGKADVIQKFLVRFKLKNVAYKPDGETGSSFLNVIEAISRTYADIKQAQDSQKNTISQFFWDRYSEIVHNAVTLLASITLDTDQFNAAVLHLLDLLKRDNVITYFRLLKHLRFLFQRRQKDFSNETLVQFYKAAIENKEFHADRFFEILCSILQDRSIKVELTETQFEIVRRNFLNELLSEHSDNAWYATAYIFSTIQNTHQTEIISAHVSACLAESFKSDKYYMAVMFDIIPIDVNYNSLYAATIEVIVKQGQKNRFWPSKEYYTDSRIDNFFNFCWKFSIPIRPGILEHGPNLGSYYRWILDMDNFDYTEFSSDWLYEHFTIYFKRRFRQCKVLKSHLLKVIKDDANTELERIFMMIYCYDD